MNVAVIEDISGNCRYRHGITSTSLFTPVMIQVAFSRQQSVYFFHGPARVKEGGK